MSIQVMSDVWKLDLPRDQKFVLLAIADHARDDGYAYPSMKRIAWKCGYDQARSISRIVQKLIDAGVLAKIEPARGRTPTLYQIRVQHGRMLPDFDPEAFSTKGAKNAPHDNSGTRNPRDAQRISESENAKGAENAPHPDSGAKNAPQSPPDDSVGVRSGTVGVRFPTRRGALASAPEPLNHHRTKERAPARGAPAQGPGPAEQNPELFVLNNTAKNLGIHPKTPHESIDDLRRRINARQQDVLNAKLSAMQGAAG